ncbi:MAG: glycosyltransferase, partial [Rhodobacteraceae bacterium]|nr:glycosyltransferase [Paracoccaceae bacterium]
MPKPIRIFFPYVGGDTIGGSHVSSLKLVAALDRDRFEPVIALHREGGALGEYVASLGMEYQVISKPAIIAPKYSRTSADASLAGYLTRSVPGFTRLLREMKIDIVHTNDGRMHVSWALPARLSGARFVWYHRQGPGASGANKVAPLLADKILSVSQFARPSHPIRSIDSRFDVVRSPFDFSTEPPDAAACHAALCDELGVPKNALLLGYFGLLNSRKRPDHFVRAIAHIAAAMPE